MTQNGGCQPISFPFNSRYFSSGAGPVNILRYAGTVLIQVLPLQG